MAGDFEMGSQYPFTMEPQSTFCLPRDDGGLEIYSSMQWMHLGHIAVAESLKIPQSKIRFSVKRLGGSYGVKITRSLLVACACALACHLTRLPVRFVMTIESNMTVLGKRYPNAIDYTANIDSVSGRLIDLSVKVIADVGMKISSLLSVMLSAQIKSQIASTAQWYPTRTHKIKYIKQKFITNFFKTKGSRLGSK